MVEIIKNSLNRIEPRKANTANADTQTASKSAIAAPAKDSVELKSAENMSAMREMAASAPIDQANVCLLYTSPSPRDGLLSRMPSSA